MALVVASAALRAVEFVGMPEARIPLAQAALYVARAPKSNASSRAIFTGRYEFPAVTGSCAGALATKAHRPNMPGKGPQNSS